MPSSSVYTTAVERGNSPLSDWCLDYLKARIVAPWLDIGCNSGALLAEVPGGAGIDSSPEMIERCRAKGLDVMLGSLDVAYLGKRYGKGYPLEKYATVVLGSVLEQCEHPEVVLECAQEMGVRVIGLTPIPGAPWGTVGYNEFVKSVISREWLEARGCVVTEFPEKGKLYFEWTA